MLATNTLIWTLIQRAHRREQDDVKKITGKYSNMRQTRETFPLCWTKHTRCLPRRDIENALFVGTYFKEPFLPSWNDLTNTDYTLDCWKAQPWEDPNYNARGELQGVTAVVPAYVSNSAGWSLRGTHSVCVPRIGLVAVSEPWTRGVGVGLHMSAGGT